MTTTTATTAAATTSSLPASSSTVTTTSATVTTRLTAKSLLKETMGEASAKQYEYLFEDDDDFTLPLADATTIVTTDTPEDNNNSSRSSSSSHHYDDHDDYQYTNTTSTTTNNNNTTTTPNTPNSHEEITIILQKIRQLEHEYQASLRTIQYQEELLKRQRQQFQEQHRDTQHAMQQCQDMDRKLDGLVQAVITPLQHQLRTEQQGRHHDQVKIKQLKKELLLVQQQQQQHQDQQHDQTAQASSMQQQQLQQQQQQQEYIERRQLQQEQVVLAKDEETKRIVKELVSELEATHRTNQHYKRTIQHMGRNFTMERAEWIQRVQDLQRQLQKTQTKVADVQEFMEWKGVQVELSSESQHVEEDTTEPEPCCGWDEENEDEVETRHDPSPAQVEEEEKDHPVLHGVCHPVLVTPDHPPYHTTHTTTTAAAPTTTTTTVVQSFLESDDDDDDNDANGIIQAGIDLADSLIELLLEGKVDTEVSVLEQMHVLDQLLLLEEKTNVTDVFLDVDDDDDDVVDNDNDNDKDVILQSRSPTTSILESDDGIEEEEEKNNQVDHPPSPIMAQEGTWCSSNNEMYNQWNTQFVDQERLMMMLARQREDEISTIEHVVDEDDQVDADTTAATTDETKATIFPFPGQQEYEELCLHLVKRVRQLEQERDGMMQESLDMLEAARAANVLELQVQKAEMEEVMHRTIEIRLMEELQKTRTIHVVPEE